MTALLIDVERCSLVEIAPTDPDDNGQPVDGWHLVHARDLPGGGVEIWREFTRDEKRVRRAQLELAFAAIGRASESLDRFAASMDRAAARIERGTAPPPYEGETGGGGEAS